MSPRQQPNNPHWPPSTAPSLGGAPHGLQANEPEGMGVGRCVAVLCGGPSGGHDAAVLNAVSTVDYADAVIDVRLMRHSIRRIL
jgi:polycomb protein EED